MLTEDRARTLLHLAADTIDVEPAAPIRTPARRPVPWWEIGAASTVFVLIAAGVGLVTYQAHHNGTAVDTATSVTDPFAQNWPAPTDPNLLQLAPNQMPSLFGYSTDDATALLQSHGLNVAVHHEDSCDPTPDRVISSKPELGSIVRAGQTITLTATTGNISPAASCVAGSGDYGLAWQFLDWVDGREHAPTFADRVTGEAADSSTTFVGPGTADKLSEWGAAFDQLRDATRQVFYQAGGTSYLAPVLQVVPDLNYAGPGRRLTISLQSPNVESDALPLASVQLTLDAVDAIIDVDLVVDGRPLAMPRQPYSPRVEGDPVTFATQRLEEYGYAVTVDPSSCSELIVATEEIDPDKLTAHLIPKDCGRA